MLKRLTVPALLCLALPAQAAPPAQRAQLDANPALFTVLAALNAAGYDADLASPANHPLREAIRREIAAKNPPSLPRLKQYFADHRPGDARYELSQYISFALSVSDPPEFAWRFRGLDLPPEVAALGELPELLTKFYLEADIETLWKRSQPAFDQAIARYQEPVSQALLLVNAYTRSFTSGFLGRRFQIYLDLLGAPNQIHLRNYGDDFFVVITSSPEPQVDDVRHAYLYYLVDASAMKYGTTIQKKKALIDLAQAAPALPEHYKNDFLLLTINSLVRAIEARLDRAHSAELVDRALKEGFILTPHFAEQLPVYEKQEQSIRYYFPELINSIDLKKEEKRLEGVQFAQEAYVRKAKTVPVVPPPPLAGAAKTLDEAEGLYEKRQLEPAREAYQRVLKETEDKLLHAKAFYGLARITVLKGDPEAAEKLFRNALELNPDPHTRGWVLVYLGRLAHGFGEEEKAVDRYREALAVEGISRAARAAAEKGIRETPKK